MKNFSKRFNTISSEDLSKKLPEDNELTIIDTLSNDHFKKVHIPGAQNACVFEVAFIDKISKLELSKETEIILYGADSSTMDAKAGAEKLLRAGYMRASILEGGLQQWKDSGFDLEGENIEIVSEPSPVPEIRDGNYRVDVEESRIEWTGRNPSTTHFGTIDLSSGDISIKNGNVTGALDIKMNSIRNINLEGDPFQQDLVDHLRSDDFFFVKLFPEAAFEIRSVTLKNDPDFSSPNVDVKGDLILKGIKKEIEFPATVNYSEEGELLVEAHLDIDRTLWGIIYGSSRFFKHLGMHLVFDLISIQIRIIAR